MAKKPTDSLLVDTNILLEAMDVKRRHHIHALRLLETDRQLVMPAQVIREFLVVATRSVAKNGFGLPMKAALENVAAFRRNIRLLPEEKPILPRFLELAAMCSFTGSRLHDVHLVATALTHKVKHLVTLNTADFIQFQDRIDIVTPDGV